MSRKIHNLGDYAAIARSDTLENNRSILPDTGAPVQQISRIFPYQSYFSDTLLQTAILSQALNEPIVRSTLQTQQTPGYAVGLHPNSQTPVAVLFNTGGQPSASQAIIIKPGQIVRPYGLPPGSKSGSFAGFQWGLPFGWLGGGVATLLVFSSPDADIAWPGAPEVIIQRQRMQILAPAAVTADAPLNWPIRFPWRNAFAGTVQQAGSAAIAIEPTRVLVRLRLATLAAPATMRFVFQGTNDFDLDLNGVVVLTPASFVEHTWGSYAASGAAANLATEYPIQAVDDEIVQLGSDFGGVQLVDVSAGTLTNAYVDVVRYGRI